MRDAVRLEALGIPTTILVNDVFEPIAHATAALLELPGDYVAKNIVWLPHPTSNLTAIAAATLVDERIDRIRASLLGRAAQSAPERGHANGSPALANGAGAVSSAAAADLAIARAAIDGLAGSLRADGADLILESFADGVLAGELRIGDPGCDDGSCIMPADALERMVEALVKPKVVALRSVTLRETKTT